MSTKLAQESNKTYAVVLGDANSYLSEKRAVEAAKLYARGNVSDIVLVGTHDEVGLMFYTLLRKDVPPKIISYDGDSRDTVDNFYGAAKLLAMIGEQNIRLLLVTSRFHMARALHIFNKLGLYEVEGHAVHDTNINVLYRYVLEVPMLLFSAVNIHFNKKLDNKKGLQDLAEKIKSKLYRGDIKE
ncbi:MAG: YdcF family protein [Candidatus Micrarchaeia archaeon]